MSKNEVPTPSAYKNKTVTGNNVNYAVHPSPALVDLFRNRPYQGQDPKKAKVLILGNDANYPEEIKEESPLFMKILEYHKDGIRFWQRNFNTKGESIHHPFLLPNRDYPFNRRKGGYRYHLNFSKMKFTSNFAECFSFIELLNVPTIGNTGDDIGQFFRLLEPPHLEWIENLILNGDKKLVIINQTLRKLIIKINEELNVMHRLVDILRSEVPPPSVILKNENTVLYNGYSFSYCITNSYLNVLGNDIKYFCEKGDWKPIES